MTDLYSELLVKREQTVKDKVIKFLLMGLTGLSVVSALLLPIPIFWILAIVFGVSLYFVLPKLDLEYEYVFVNGELDIDKIMAKSKRKRAKSLDLTKMEIMAPVNSHRLDYQNHNTNIKVLDFSSGNKEHKIFAVIIPDGKDLCKVLIEPDQELIENIQKSCPRKVFVD